MDSQAVLHVFNMLSLFTLVLFFVMPVNIFIYLFLPRIFSNFLSIFFCLSNDTFSSVNVPHMINHEAELDYIAFSPRLGPMLFSSRATFID